MLATALTETFTEDPHVDSWTERPVVAGKFLALGNRKLYLKGVTYGTFAAGPDGSTYPHPTRVAADFAAMARCGVNTVRTYTAPPRWLLDTAQQHGLRVMVGLAWEQHVAFLDNAGQARAVRERVRAQLRDCLGHPAVLNYVVGNEIPAPIVRWHGKRAVERFIHQLYDTVKEEDPESLVTYVNYPSTEYLTLPFLDFFSFNVYLERRDRLEAYLSRLHNLAGDRPLVLAEIGLDSRSKGELVQAHGLEWQLRTAFASGCAGAFVFAWTDEWNRGAAEIVNWDFGLTTRDRRPKPALAVVSRVFREVPFPSDRDWPKISVVVCSYNGARTIRACLDGLMALEYPNCEVIVVNDGSTDATPRIISDYPFRVISQPNRGLSAARNAGLAAATGEIVAYIDDDAIPDPHWLHYLADTYLRADFAVVGGPNIPPPDDPPLAACVANAPGGPIHVLISDREAEHVPGCNLSARASALRAINGFDETFRVAGDDVDVCWRIQDRGWKLGFHPGAMVWHRRRSSIHAYWKQQKGYGKAEALLARKWPAKYTPAGHIAWAGRLYGRGLLRTLPLSGSRVYHGQWGSGLFQSVYEPAPGYLRSIPLMPEWYLVIAVLAALSLLGVLWPPLLWCTPFLALSLAISLTQAVLGARHAAFTTHPPSRLQRFQRSATVAALHLLQPLARLAARVAHGLTVWRTAGTLWHARLPQASARTVWSELWRAPDDWLSALEQQLRAPGVSVQRGSHFDRWDLMVQPGLLAGARLLMTVEEHGAGRQLLRFRLRPTLGLAGLVVAGLAAGLSAAAAGDGCWIAAAILGLGSGLTLVLALAEWGHAYRLLCEAIDHLSASSVG